MKNDYSVKKGPFIIKLVICSIYMLSVIGMLTIIPDEIRDDVYYSSEEYYLTNLDNDRRMRRFDDMYMVLDLYNLTSDKYDEYWELVNGYRDYVLYANYKNVSSKGYTIEGVDNKEEIYRNIVMRNAENVTYENNARYLREFADIVRK